MHKLSFVTSLQSFVALPILATNLFTGTIAPDKLPTVRVLASEEIRTPASEITDNQQKIREEEAAKINAYFSDKHLPLGDDYGMRFVIAAEDNNLPWNLLPAIAMAESTGYKFIIPGTNNGFGWNGGKTKFQSVDEAIKIIASHLGGNREATKRYYKDKSLEEIINTYNPPEIAPKYLSKVKSIMKAIENYEVSESEQESA